MDLSQQVIDLNKLQGAADDLARAVHPLSMSAHQIVQAQAQWVAIKSVVKQLDASVLGESYDDSGRRQPRAENAAKLKRMGLDVKFCAIRNESQLLEMQEAEAEEKEALEAVAGAKAKGVAAARSRFGN